jgi:hypothetical protein
MKTLFFSFSILILSFLTFAQTQLPDSIFIVDGRSTSCLITSIDDSRVQFSYNINQKESVIVKALSRIYIEKYGNIFSPISGFTVNLDEVNSFLQDRLQKKQKEQEVKAELDRVDLSKKPGSNISSVAITGSEDLVTIVSHSTNACNQNKWSFGVLYVPYYSGRIYEMSSSSYSQYDVSIYGYSVSLTNLEAQFAYAVVPQLKLTFDAGYSATISEENFETHYKYNDPVYPYETNEGYKLTNNMKRLDFNIGAKYYFNNIISNKVSIYASLGIGKQFAFVTNDYKLLFGQPDPAINENNYEEFLADINSPFHFNIGFGAEYFFNESLSLNANIKINYNTSSGKYQSRNISQYSSRTTTEDISVADFTTKVGIGLNFYF